MYAVSLFLGLVRGNQHLAKVPQLCGSTYFLCKERKLDYVEELVVKFVCFVKVFLLHVMPYTTVLAV